MCFIDSINDIPNTRQNYFFIGQHVTRKSHKRAPPKHERVTLKIEGNDHLLLPGLLHLDFKDGIISFSKWQKLFLSIRWTLQNNSSSRLLSKFDHLKVFSQMCEGHEKILGMKIKKTTSNAKSIASRLFCCRIGLLSVLLLFFLTCVCVVSIKWRELLCFDAICNW